MDKKSVPALMMQITLFFVCAILILIVGMLLTDVGGELLAALRDTLGRYARMAFGKG